MGIFSFLQLSTMLKMAAILGPASLLPICSQFLRLWKYFDSRNYVHFQIMCSRPSSVSLPSDRGPRFSGQKRCVGKLSRLANCA